MERFFGAIALIALVGVPFWLSRRKKKDRVESWGDENSPYINGGEIKSDDISSHSGDSGHHV
jgi:FtsZ-interacting cell division protein ZipA